MVTVKNRGDQSRVHRAVWKKTKLGFEVRTRSRPQLVGHGKTYAEAIDAIWREVFSKTGDGEAYIDVEDPPPPSADTLTPYFKGQMFSVSGNDNAVVTNLSDLFSGGICSACGNPAGRRTAVPACLKRAPNSAGAVVVAMRASIFSRPFVDAVESFVPRTLFKPMEEASSSKSRQARQFYELDVGKAVSAIAVRLPLKGGYECSKCGYRSLTFSIPGWAGVFIDEIMAKEPFLVLGNPGRSGDLLLRGDLWKRLRLKKLSKIVAGETPVVPIALVDPKPKLTDMADEEED
jgi:hypothetical protein